MTLLQTRVRGGRRSALSAIWPAAPDGAVPLVGHRANWPRRGIPTAGELYVQRKSPVNIDDTIQPAMRPHACTALRIARLATTPLLV